MCVAFPSYSSIIILDKEKNKIKKTKMSLFGGTFLHY